jgi:hypothetical protein
MSEALFDLFEAEVTRSRIGATPPQFRELLVRELRIKVVSASAQIRDQLRRDIVLFLIGKLANVGDDLFQELRHCDTLAGETIPDYVSSPSNSAVER